MKNTGAGVPEHMTVKELIKILEQQNQEALVYYTYDGEQAHIVMNVVANVFSRKDETVLIT